MLSTKYHPAIGAKQKESDNDIRHLAAQIGVGLVVDQMRWDYLLPLLTVTRPVALSDC